MINWKMRYKFDKLVDCHLSNDMAILHRKAFLCNILPDMLLCGQSQENLGCSESTLHHFPAGTFMIHKTIEFHLLSQVPQH